MFNKFLIYILLSVLYCNEIRAQSFLEMSYFDTSHVAAGIVNNHNLVVDYRPTKKIYITLYNTVYIDYLKYQLFQIEANYKAINKSRLLFTLGGRFSGNYHLTDLKAYLNQSISYDFLDRISLSEKGSFIFNKKSKLAFYGRAGFLIHIAKELDFTSSYGSDLYYNSQERYFEMGLYLKEKKLSVFPSLQIPGNTPVLKYSRISISFIYTIF